MKNLYLLFTLFLLILFGCSKKEPNIYKATNWVTTVNGLILFPNELFPCSDKEFYIDHDESRNLLYFYSDCNSVNYTTQYLLVNSNIEGVVDIDKRFRIKDLYTYPEGEYIIWVYDDKINFTGFYQDSVHLIEYTKI